MSENNLTYFFTIYNNCIKNIAIILKTKKLLGNPIVFKKGVIYKKLIYSSILAHK